MEKTLDNIALILSGLFIILASFVVLTIFLIIVDGCLSFYFGHWVIQDFFMRFR